MGVAYFTHKTTSVYTVLTKSPAEARNTKSGEELSSDIRIPPHTFSILELLQHS